MIVWRSARLALLQPQRLGDRCSRLRHCSPDDRDRDTLLETWSWTKPFVLTLSMLLALIAQTSAAAADDRASCHHFRLIERTDIIGRAAPSSESVSARDICVPSGYFMPWIGRRKYTIDLAIDAKWPSMEGIWDKPLPGKEYDPVTHGNLLNIWFALSASFTSVDFRFHAEKKLSNDNQPSVPQYGLEHLVPDQTNTRPQSELYFKPEEIHSMFIECKLPSYARYPGCTNHSSLMAI